MKVTEYTCDCGCGKQSGPHHVGWLLVSQPTKPRSDNEAKLEEKLHFATLHCLTRWSDAMAPHISELEKWAVDSPTPRGELRHPKMPAIYV